MNEGENKESITLIWFDSNTRSCKDTQQTIRQLRLINDYVILCSGFSEFMKRIQSIDQEMIFLIISGEETPQILSSISSVHNIHSVFIFNKEKTPYEDALTEYSNVIGTYRNLDDLCTSVKEQIDLVDKQTQTFSFFDQHQILTKDLSRQSAKFLWFQLFYRTLTSLPRNSEAKQQMIQACKEYYDGNTNEMKFIDEFENNYRSEDAIVWYWKRSFLYKLINKALRTHDIDLLYMFRFFIDDLTENLQREHEKLLSSKDKMLNVYRGVKFRTEEFDNLKENCTKLIFTNGYFSTSMSKEFELNTSLIRTTTIDVVSVLFHIQCHIEQIHENVLFANINQLSEQQDHQLVLFDCNTCFQIESIEKHAALYIIKMNLSNQGQQITKDYIELIQNETEETNLLIHFGRLFFDLGEYDKSQKYFQRLLKNSNDKDRAWIEFSIGQVYHVEGELNQAREYYDRAYEHMIKNKPTRMKGAAQVLQQIGSILYHQNKYDEALDFNLRALTIRQICHPSGDVDTVAILDKIGDVFLQQKKYDQAVDYYQRALKIREELHASNDVNTATSLDKIGSILQKQEKYDGAVHFYQRALKIRQKLYPNGHADIASILHSMGIVSKNQNKYGEAMNYLRGALKIMKTLYPAGHDLTARSLHGMGATKFAQAEFGLSMYYFEQSLKVLNNLNPSGHAGMGSCLGMIGCCYLKQKKPKEALQYYQQALSIYEKVLPHNDHPRQEIMNIIHRLSSVK
ncbi:unnamed protein product [Rotaria magnacalcarata]|nr:unnamed protein product [Rotaria magnacalcarata]CAF2108342.1 unnamed protein product [Rotaria magnacalcarata]